MAGMFTCLFLVGAASAQVTTSIWQQKIGAGLNEAGFIGSVINVSGPLTTFALNWDNGTNTRQIGLRPDPLTVTVGPSIHEIQGRLWARKPASKLPITDDLWTATYRAKCTQDTRDADAVPVCTTSWSTPLPFPRSYVCLAGDGVPATTQTFTFTRTYSGRGSDSASRSIVATVTQRQTLGSRPGLPDWCIDTNLSPSGGLIETATYRRDDFSMYPVVITAGAEKMSATPSATVSSSGAATTPTAGAMGPVVAGLGAAVAMFL